jgi:signal transduction histidine kinase
MDWSSSEASSYFAFWFDGASDVFLSNDLKNVLGWNWNSIDSYDFLRKIKALTGNALITALNDVHSFSSGDRKIEKYDQESGYTLIISFVREKKLYILEILPPNKLVQFEFVDSLPIYVWQRDQDLRIRYCNKAYARAVDNSAKDVIKSNISLVPPEYGAHPLEKVALGTGKTQKATVSIVIKGNIHFLEITEVPALGKKLPFGYAVDITENKKIEKEYIKYKKQTNDTLHQISVPIIIFDKDKKVVFANDSVIKVFGFDNSFLATNPLIYEILDFLHDKRRLMETADYQDVKKKVDRLFTDIISPYHTTIYMADGRTLNVMVSPNYDGGLIFVFEDVTDRIALEREYKALSAVQKETLEHLHEGILVFGADNKIKITNPAINGIWNKTDDTRVNEQHLKNFFLDVAYLFNSSEEIDAWMYQLISLSTRRFDFSGSLSFTNGKVIDYAYVPLPDGLNLVRFVDSTDKHNLEKTLVDKANILSQIDKLKSYLISSVSYEFKSPINTITGFTDILLNQYFGDLNERQKEYCLGILTSAERLEKVVEAMMNLANIEAGQLTIQYKEVCLYLFIKECVSLFEVKARNSGVTIRIEKENEDLKVYVDQKSMQQVFFQILSRDLMLTPTDGSITIKIELCATIPDYVDIVMTNTGIGLGNEDAEKMNKVFLEDIDETNVNNTLDFGTILANNIIRLHHGKMSIEIPKSGKGSATRCRLPIKPFLT